MPKTVKIGEIAIDTGRIVISDPSYLKMWTHEGDPWRPEESTPDDIPFSLKGSEHAVEVEGAALLMRGMAVAVETGEGSPGMYPVYAEYNHLGFIQRIWVQFLELEPEPEPYVEEAQVIPQPGEEPPPYVGPIRPFFPKGFLRGGRKK